MEKVPIDLAPGSQLASLIDTRLRGNQQLFLVSVGARENPGHAAAEKDLLALLDEMRRNVAASGVGEAELNQAIDQAVSDARACSE